MRFRIYCLLSFVLAQHCVLVQIQKKDTVLSRNEEKTETREDRRVSASLKELGFENGTYKLAFTVRTKITITERKHFQEKVLTENRLFPEGKRLRFFAGWIAFAFEDEGWGSYFLDILGGIPLTLGINLPIAVGDWLSMPFRLSDEKSERVAKEDKKLAHSEEPADCPRFSIRILKVDYPLDAACRLQIEAAIFEEIATRHPYPPKFPGSFRYELIDTTRHEAQMNSTVFVRKFPGQALRLEFFERQ